MNIGSLGPSSTKSAIGEKLKALRVSTGWQPAPAGRFLLAVARLLLLGECLAQRGLLQRLFVVLLITFAVTLALLFGKRLAQLGFLQGALVILLRRVAFAVALALLLGKRLTQRSFLQRLFFLRAHRRRLLRLHLGLALFLLGRTLRRQLDAVRSQLSAGRNTYRIRPRQLRPMPCLTCGLPSLVAVKAGMKVAAAAPAAAAAAVSSCGLAPVALNPRSADVGTVALRGGKIKGRTRCRLRGRILPIAQARLIVVPIRIDGTRRLRRRRFFRDFEGIQRRRRLAPGRSPGAD